jgi:hypothetical protein
MLAKAHRGKPTTKAGICWIAHLKNPNLPLFTSVCLRGGAKTRKQNLTENENAFPMNIDGNTEDSRNYWYFDSF